MTSPAISLDMIAIVNQARTRLGETSHRASIALAAVSVMPDGADVFPLPDTFMQTVVSTEPAVNSETKDECRAWLTGIALREGIDGLGLLCEDLWRIAHLLHRNRSSRIMLPGTIDYTHVTFRQLASIVLAELAAQIDRLGVEEKLDALDDTFGIRTFLRDDVGTLVRARNCLTHRLGIVGPEDVNDPDTHTLRVRFRAHQIVVTPPGEAARRIVKPTEVPGGGALGIQFFAPQERAFGVGRRVQFPNQEFMHLITTLLGAQDTLAQATLVLAKRSPSPSTTADSAGNG